MRLQFIWDGISLPTSTRVGCTPHKDCSILCWFLGSEPFSHVVCLGMQVGKGVLTYVSQEVKDLYNLVENEFHPLDLAAKIQPHLSKLSKLSDKLSSASPVPEVQLEQYVPALERLTTLRVLQQVILHPAMIYCMLSHNYDCDFLSSFMWS